MKNELNETVNILLAFGGSGGKTVASLMEQMANDPQAARVASQRVHIVLCDTDDGDLEKARARIEQAFSSTGLSNPPKIEMFRLADSVDLFQDLVSERMRAMTPEGKATIRQYWWFEPTRDGRGDRPFSASSMPENVNRGAAQCPLVSHFLAWDKLAEFELVLEKIATHCKNTLNLEHFSVDLFVIAGLAGGTGRGSWQALAFKAREYFWQDKNGRRACRPIGFFFDWTCFRDVAAQRPEQAIKLQVNSYTGLSELSMWLRSALPADGLIAQHDAGVAREKAFLLPSLRAPADRSAAAIDTERYMPESDEARLGRTPIHRAYIFTGTSRSMSVQTSDEAYQLAAAAIYGRLCISQTRSADSNEPERACATATSVLAVPIARIRLAILKFANTHRIAQLLHGETRGDGSGGPRQPLTRSEGRDGIVVLDQDLRGKIADARRGLERLLAIGSRDQFAALGDCPQLDPGNPLSVLAFKVCERGERAVVGQLDNREKRDAILDEVARAQQNIAGTVPGAVGEAFRDLVQRLGVTTGDLVGADLQKQRRHQRSMIIGKFVVEKVLSALRDGVGPACAMAEELRQAAEKSQRAIQAAAAEDDSGAPNTSDREWAKPYFGIFGRIRLTQQDGFRQAVRSRLCAAAYPSVARELKDLAAAIVEHIELLRKALEDTVKVLEDQRHRIEREAHELRKECFTELRGMEGGRLNDQNRMREQLMKDKLRPVSKMLRRLRPIYREAEFQEIVARLAGDSKAVETARVELQTFLSSRVAAIEERSERNAYEFRTALEDQLRNLLERQSVEFKDLRDVYNLEIVLDRLCEAWFDTYRERKADQQWVSSFSREVEALVGYDLQGEFERIHDQASGHSIKEDDLRPLTGSEILSRAALKLAAGCDPFVQYSSSGDRRDRATVILPNHPVPGRSKTYSAQVEVLSRESGNFAHVKAVESVDNFFTLVATADLPKVNFADTGWDGWFSEPADPAVRKWLDWCEDDQGVAPFKTADGSVGLGYICPKYVKDPHLSARRWKPWVKDDRNREQMHRKWVALAYSLLGNGWYKTEVKSEWADRYAKFVEVFRKTFGGVPGPDWHVEAPNPDFPAELWTLPLIEEKEGGRGPTFKRRTWTSTAQGLRLTGLDPRDVDDVTSSMRKFVNWFDSEESDRAVNAVLTEQAIFANKLRKVRDTNDHLHAVTSAQHVEAIRKFLREFVSQWQTCVREVKGLATEERDRQVEFLDRFIRFFDSGMPDLNLLEPFDGTRV